MPKTNCTIKVVCQRLRLSPRTVRTWVREGMVEGQLERGEIRFDEAALERMGRIHRLRHDLGVNLAGIDIILRLCERINDLSREVAALRGEMASTDTDVSWSRPQRDRDRAPRGAPEGEIVRIEVIEDESA